MGEVRQLFTHRDLHKFKGNLAIKLNSKEIVDYSKEFAPSWAPLMDDLTTGRKLHSFLKEFGLHLRLAGVGFYRGLVLGTGIFGVARLHATKIKCMCGQPKYHLGYICPVARYENLGLLSTKVITDAGVAFLVDDWDNNGTDLTNLNFHGCGTGTTAEDQTQTALVTECTTVLNPDNTRATGTRSQPAANQYRTVGTPSFDGAAAVTEHGIFSQAATGGGTMWDRSVFSAINVASGDSIQFTYTCTVSAGG